MTIPIFESDATLGPSRSDWARRAAALEKENEELRAELARLKEQNTQTEASCEKVWDLVKAERARCGVLEGELEAAKERIEAVEAVSRDRMWLTPIVDFDDW